MLRFVLVTLRAAYPANVSCKLQFQISASLWSAKIRFLTTPPGELKWCVYCYLLREQPVLQIWAENGNFRFWPIWGQQKVDFPQLVPERPNGAFCVTYAESSLSCNFKLNSAILDFDWFEMNKNPLFHNSSRRPHLVRFVLVTLRAA